LTNLAAEIPFSEIKPLHVAIIMDGNGRWANERGLPRTMGHREGAKAVSTAIESALDHEIKYLTLFGFSRENWNRSPSEVSAIMGLLRLHLTQDGDKLKNEGIAIRFIGGRDKLPADVRDLIEKSEQETANNRRLYLTLAIDYGGRQELTDAARRLAKLVLEGEKSLKDIDEFLFSQHLATYGMPDPDLIIRTSGEQRVSNFLLWQMAYSEFWFTNVHWPDFSKKTFDEAVRIFQRRERRFGS
jgi:undecaprenyl diphosphate synthase